MHTFLTKSSLQARPVHTTLLNVASMRFLVANSHISNTEHASQHTHTEIIRMSPLDVAQEQN